MRRTSYPNKKWFQRPEGAYSRSSSWTTRYYHRKTGNSTISTMSGLNVTNSSLEMKKGESPYLLNARLQGAKETKIRAQSMSRPGQKFLNAPKGMEHENVIALTGDHYWVSVKEFQTIRYKLYVTDRVTSIGYYLKKGDIKSNAYFIAIIRDKDSDEELCRAFISVNDIKDGQLHWFRLIKSVNKEVNIDITLIDDMNKTGTPLASEVKIAFSGENGHQISEHKIPNVNKALRETPLVFHRGVGSPLTCTKTTTWKTFPVWLQGGHFVAEGKRWIAVGAINNDNKKVVYAYPYLKMDSGMSSHKRINEDLKVLIPEDKINQSAETIRMTQAGHELFFVDGYSKLQKVDLTNWSVKDAVPTSTDLFDFIPKQHYYKSNSIFRNGFIYTAKADFNAGDNFEEKDWDKHDLSEYTAWAGASLIYFLNNRLFLSGFYRDTVGVQPKSEPNLVIMSSIDSIAPKYDFFNRSVEFFHVPDRAPTSTISSPITGFADLNDNLVVFLADTLGFISVPAGVEHGNMRQSTPVGSGFGILKQEHVVQGRNNIYFYNPSEGVMRLGGQVSSVVSNPIDSLLKSIRTPEKVSMQIHKKGLRLYYHTDGDTNDMCLYDYYAYATHKSYWFRDNNTPIAYMNSDTGYDVEIGVGSEYPCVIEAEVGNTGDFDCAIEYEYHTNYIPTPAGYNNIIVRRIYATSMQDFNASLFLGLDVDHKNNPIVWRRFITANNNDSDDANYIFRDTGSKGSTTVKARILTADADMAQIRLKQYCYNSQASILKCGFQYGEGPDL